MRRNNIVLYEGLNLSLVISLIDSRQFVLIGEDGQSIVHLSISKFGAYRVDTMDTMDKNHKYLQFLWTLSD